MRYRILGALHVLGLDGRPCAFERRQGRIMAVLLLSANQTVSREYLIDAVWDEAPPATATRQLQNCVSHLRQNLAGTPGWKHVISAEPGGYRIHVDGNDLDAAVFRAVVAEARRQQAAGRVADATTKLRDALALWQGPALAGMTGRVIEAGSARLNEQRLSTWEEYLDLELQQGRHYEVVGELLELVAANPLRERMVGLLMRALHGSGRQSEALRAFDQLRRRLADELGLDPGPQLLQLHASILRNTLPVAVSPSQQPAAQPTALRQLPAPVRHFVGRDTALAELDRQAETADGEAVAISVIHGTGGVGKTALAVRWAHKMIARFPDGQLFVNLRGFDPAREPMPPSEAIRGFLHALAIPAERIPMSLDAQVSLYRTMLADRRMLIVLDNARDADQIRPLLAGGPGCMVVVTSRNELTGLVALDGARPLTLDLLTESEARHLLAGHLGQARVAAEPAAVDGLIAHCAKLPLALAIIAARAAAHPSFPLATFAAELADARRRLDAVDGGDQFSRARSVFSWSYQRLSGPAARLFRLLGLVRGDVTTAIAANLADIPAAEARLLLVDLARAHMVTEHTTGRYAFHDLLSAYATERAHLQDSEADRQAAVRRVLGYYVYAAAAADVLLTPHRRRTPLPPIETPHELPDLADYTAALAWLEAERGNLVAAVTLAAAHGEHAIGWRLANLLWGLFELQRRWDDWIATHLIGLACARADADLKAEFIMLSSLGIAYRECRAFDAARGCHEQALRISRELADRHGEAQALNGIGAVHADARQPQQARRHFLQALQIRREIGDLWGEAITICNLGGDDLERGRPESARENFLAALRIRRQIGDRSGEATALCGLGEALHASGDAVEAIGYFSEALVIHRELHDYAMLAFDLRGLGMIYRDLGQDVLGEAHLRDALAIYRRLGMPEADDVQRTIDQMRAA